MEKGVSCHSRGIEETVFSHSNSEITTLGGGRGTVCNTNTIMK